MIALLDRLKWSYNQGGLKIKHCKIEVSQYLCRQGADTCVIYKVNTYLVRTFTALAASMH